MKAIVLLVALSCGTGWCLGDAVSGPDRSTIQGFPWGSIYYEPGSAGAYQLDPTSEGFRFHSNQGDVTISRTNVNGYRLGCGQDALTITQNMADLEIRGPDRSWTVRSRNGQCTLACSSPRDTVVFDRNANTFNIKGGKGLVTGTTQFEKLQIKSPLGTSTVTTAFGQRTFSGVPLDQIPYLGRGLFIPFHGVGVFVDMARLFPIPEVAEWVEWKAIVLSP